VEWGYRFKVIPIEGNTSKNVKDPLLNRLNIESALWVMEEVVMSYQELPYALGRFARKEFLHALTLFIHTVTDTD